jgi:N-acetylmuramic acid 6-phosphate etherase
MSDAIEKAKKFLSEEQAFRLGELLTESFHPKTQQLSQIAQDDLVAAIRMLQSVDWEIPPAMEKVFGQDVFEELIAAFITAMDNGRRIYFTGCGATGRLSILLEAAWRRFWRDHPQVSAKLPQMEDRTISLMAGGDFALIKSVEGFEDFPDFGRFQLRQAGVKAGDVVVAITEGGETPFVIGTAWEGLDAGAQVFFVYNNPTDVLRRHVQRSREVIDEPRIRKLDLTTGPMAITGSTRMQATTAELLVVGAALEIALVRFLQGHLSERDRAELGLQAHSGGDYHRMFVNLLSDLSNSAAVRTMARATSFEESIYRQHGLITYMTDWAMLDVLTDTTERSPTFMLPPFRKNDDNASPRPWAFVKDPLRPTQDAWREMLQREPRGLDWQAAIYEQLNAPTALKANPPRLDNSEIYKFQIGNEPDTSRSDAPDSALVLIDVAGETCPAPIDALPPSFPSDGEPSALSTDNWCGVGAAVEKFGPQYRKTAVLTIGAAAKRRVCKIAFHFAHQPAQSRETGLPRSKQRGQNQSGFCPPYSSPLRLWNHLAVKLILNTISTMTMVRMGRVVCNAMVWLSPSNKKLIDRGCRLISQQTGCSYDQACIELHVAMEEVQSRRTQGEEVPSPVALAIERIRAKHDKS